MRKYHTTLEGPWDEVLVILRWRLEMQREYYLRHRRTPLRESVIAAEREDMRRNLTVYRKLRAFLGMTQVSRFETLIEQLLDP